MIWLILGAAADAAVCLFIIAVCHGAEKRERDARRGGDS